jgi:hypothetical protein
MGLITDHPGALRVDIAVMADHSPQNTLNAALHLCPICVSPLVQPTSWERVGDRDHPAWLVGRRCPECGWTSESVHGGPEIDAFDEHLELGALELADELTALAHANMSEMASSFSFALDHDLIGADDFNR